MSVADRLIAARQSGAPFDADPADGPADAAAAHAAQAEVAAAFGPVGAFKTGRKQPDAAPLIAPILRADIRPSGAEIPAAGSRLRGVELEIAFRLERPLPDPDAPDFETRLRAATVALPALEIVESRLRDPEAAGPLWKLADNQINGGLILGAPVADWTALDLARPSLRLRIGGAVAQDGPTETPGGHPFATFAAFARRLGPHCGGLSPGATVITGSLTGLRWAKAGDLIDGRIAGLGAVSCRFA
ncbi:MAG: 2-keto-4-pentenoate hydratase [Rubrimonas sp.]|uniref:2-keto-4-pentenoate hydratase n=1 Tax=Rubrimonas sp. TaxID=2036015 RepID=UPI002FDD7018